MPNVSPNASHAVAAAARRPPLSDAIGSLVTVAVALLFAWWHPAQNRWAALGLILAVLLDAGARVIVRLVKARTGVSADFQGVASPLLMLGRAVWIGGLLVAGGSWLRPDLFPLLACTLAGLVAMGACARIASARMVTVLDAAEREAAQDKTDGRGTR
ncbi:hypothetical protein [Methylorubrum sp. POS3]|uniref:hypothetical protein n=1 Tax=Methylorubrum sp. POS3 TaxID=2998492 RepID=UPI003729D065